MKQQSLSSELWEPIFIFNSGLGGKSSLGAKKGPGLDPQSDDKLDSKTEPQPNLYESDKLSLEGKQKTHLNSGAPFLEGKRQIQKFFPKARVLAFSSSQRVYEMRNFVFKEIQSPLIYFLDEDVILDNSRQIEMVLKLHSLNPSVTAIGGAYLDHPSSSFFGKIYNWIVRLWMKRHQSSLPQDLLPAGNFSIKSSPKFSARFYSPNSSGFGAEELFFFRSLHKEGFLSSWISDLDARHLAQHRFKDFVRRAWLQGRGLPSKDWLSKKNIKIFFKEPAPFLYKFFALFYLALVRLSAIQRALFNKRQKNF